LVPLKACWTRYIYSVADLIRGTIFRNRLDPSQLEQESTGLRSLGEAIDKYHKHEAIKHRDKIYALLGMACGELRETNLVPDYKVPWGDPLEEVTRHLLGDMVHIFSWSDE
jgi:hypothetical protein